MAPEGSSLLAALQVASDGLAITDACGQYTYLNRSHLEMFGYTIDELVGRSWETIYDPIERERIGSVAFPALERTGVWRGHAVGLHKLGRPVHQEIALTALPEGGILCATRDISERIDQDRNVRQLEARLRHAERQEAMLTERRAIAHDFGNLIAAIHGYAHLAERNLAPNDPNESRIRALRQAADQAADVMARLDTAETWEAEPAVTVDLDATVRAARDIAETLRPRTVRFAATVPDSPAAVRCPDVLLSRVLLNIVKNAFEATVDRGCVCLRVVRGGLAPTPGMNRMCFGPEAGRAAWTVEVQDTGRGMTQDVLRAAFDPRFTTKADKAGSGYGLLSVVALAETGLVRVVAESAPGAGTRVRLEFLESAEPFAGAANVSDKHMDESLAYDPRVLIVDDNGPAADVLSQMMAEAGIDSLVRTDPEAALEVPDAAYDLLITDLQMPGLDGVSLARRLKARRAALPIIAVSARVPPDLPDLFNVSFPKPVHADTIVGAVRSVLGPAHDGRAPSSTRESST